MRFSRAVSRTRNSVHPKDLDLDSRPLETPKAFPGVEAWLEGNWAGERPERYSEEEWTETMLRKTPQWPNSCTDLGYVLALQGYMRCGQTICNASEAAVLWSRQNDLEEWMVKAIEDRFTLLSSLVTNTGQWLQAYGFPKLVKAGGIPPVNYPGIRMEMATREGKAKRRIEVCYLYLQQGRTRRAAEELLSAHSWICGYTTMLWQACRIDAEDVLFQFRKCYSQLQWESLCDKMHEDTRAPKSSVYYKGLGIAFACMLETMPKYEMAKKLARATTAQNLDISLLLAAFWLGYVHNGWFIKPLMAVERGRQVRTCAPCFGGRH